MGRFDDEAFDTLFLDRDGVINRLRPDDYVKNWEEFEFMPGMLDRLARWSGRFRRILVVTNQRGVGKGIMSLDDLNRIHDRMIEEIERHGGRIDRVYFCTALSPTIRTASRRRAWRSRPASTFPTSISPAR